MATKVLVVGDEKNIVQLARLYLNNEGFQVETAYDGKEALEKTRSLLKNSGKRARLSWAKPTPTKSRWA